MSTWRFRGKFRPWRAVWGVFVSIFIVQWYGWGALGLAILLMVDVEVN